MAKRQSKPGANRGGKSAGAGRRRRARRKRPLIFRLLGWGMTLAVWGAIIFAAATAYVFFTLDSKGLFHIPARKPGIMLVAADGQKIAERGAFFGDEARISELPRYLPQAVIAIEDRRFYHHFGIDPIGLTRAMIRNLRAGHVVQGGSTLTQQLAKNLFLKPERTLWRKFQEAVLAIWLESRYSKDEILQLYLNRVNFGPGAVGVEKAARKFFGRSAREVTLGQAAILAAMLKGPSRYNPLRHPARAERRAAVVLKAMLREGYITEKEAKDALRGKQTIRPSAYVPSTQYIVDWVLEQLPDLTGPFNKSIVVETTLDHNLQTAAERAIVRTLAREGKKRHVSQGAMVVMDAKGAVKAMVGGRSYKRSQFNRAVKARRQPGSAFKPFVYLTAIEQGYTPESIEDDSPVRIGDYKPANYGHKYRGRVTLRKALALSLNTVAVKLCVAVGPENVAATANRLGISSPLEPVASLALGTSEVNLLELTSAYAPFANGGKAVVPYIVTRVTTRDGKVLYERKGSGLGTVINNYDLGAMNDMMRAVVTSGTGRRARIKGRDIGGKTGTSQDYRDAWFIGYSAQLVGGVWLGNDDNSPTRRVTGGSLPARIWKDVMLRAHKNLPGLPLPGDYQRQEWSDPVFQEDRVAVNSRSRSSGGIIGVITSIFGGGARPSPAPAPREPRRKRRIRRRIQNFGPAR